MFFEKVYIENKNKKRKGTIKYKIKHYIKVLAEKSISRAARGYTTLWVSYLSCCTIFFLSQHLAASRSSMGRGAYSMSRRPCGHFSSIG
jgi:hypothetical protein